MTPLSTAELDDRVTAARTGFDDKLDELQRRFTEVRTALAPLRHWRNPWLQLAAALVTGYAAGTRAGSGVARKLAMGAATSLVHELLGPRFLQGGPP
jgi:hypothetical protein